MSKRTLGLRAGWQRALNRLTWGIEETLRRELAALPVNPFMAALVSPDQPSSEPDQDLELLRDLVQTVGGKVEFWPTGQDIEQVNITLLGHRFRIQLGLYDEIGDRGWLEVLHLGKIQREGGNE